MLFADAVIYGFIVQHEKDLNSLVRFVWYMPFAAALFWGLRWLEDVTDIGKAAEYLRKVEKDCGGAAMWRIISMAGGAHTSSGAGEMTSGF